MERLYLSSHGNGWLSIQIKESFLCQKYLRCENNGHGFDFDAILLSAQFREASGIYAFSKGNEGHEIFLGNLGLVRRTRILSPIDRDDPALYRGNLDVYRTVRLSTTPRQEFGLA